ncbi:unnamed protein product [Staurois parvus]|uniref:Uncharacterized protein n=1 Tax=Staurois parvus TaxID=386267 RepID=A0ABN9EUA5_9NEOB|nr:unnamed protein product [Staurois parvus]
MTPKGRGKMGLVDSQQLDGHQFDTPAVESWVSNWWPSSCCKITSPIMPLPLGIMLVSFNLAMPHVTCSLATAGGPPV